MRLRWQTVIPFAYCELRALFKRIYDDGFDGFKAGVVILCTEVLLLVTLLAAISVALGYRILPHTKSMFLVPVTLVVLALAALNEYVLHGDKTIARFESEFKAYSARERKWGLVAVLIFVFVSFAIFLVIGSIASHLPR
jgi:hypothetical protein